MVYNFVAMCRNIVSTVTLGCKLDLKDIALRARNAEYNPKVTFIKSMIMIAVVLSVLLL